MKQVWFSALAAGFVAGISIASADPTIHMGDIPRDTITLYDHDGSDATIIYRGKQGDAYVVEARDGDSSAGALQVTYHLDEIGQRKSMKTKDNEFTYRPHNCSRTLGTCSFRAKNGNTGKWFDLSRELTAQPDGRYAFTLYLSGSVYETGWFEPGQYGLPTAYKGGSGSNTFVGRLKTLRTPE